jgi:hypothetical protein
MLNLTSDSYVFIYSEKGIFVTPTYGTKLSCGKIDTRNQFYKSIGRFYSEFFNCFIGEHKANGQDLSILTLEEIVDLIKSKITHYIKINTEKKLRS